MRRPGITLTDLGSGASAQVERALAADHLAGKSKRAHPEQDLQISVVSTILAPLEMIGLLTYAAFSNGFKRTRAEAGIAKAMGQRAGMPDLIIWTQWGASFFLEMKSPIGGHVSGEQKDTIERMNLFDMATYVCRNHADVLKALAVHGIIPS